MGISLMLVLQWRNLSQERFQSQRLANATDTYLGAVLSSTSDPETAVATLGLPVQCEDHVGENWYTPGLQENHPCPEVMAVSRLKIFSLIVDDPAIYLRLTQKGTELLRPWIVNLGQVAGDDYGSVIRYMSSISPWLDQLSERMIRTAFFIPMLFGIAQLGWILIQSPVEYAHLLTITLSLIGTLYIVFYSSLFGDGFIDLAKHTHLFFSIYLSWLLISFVGLVGWALRHVFQNQPDNREFRQ
jgi:hypothetical protein